MVNFGPLAAEIVSLVWGTPRNFNGFRVLAALLHGTLVVSHLALNMSFRIVFRTGRRRITWRRRRPARLELLNSFLDILLNDAHKAPVVTLPERHLQQFIATRSRLHRYYV